MLRFHPFFLYFGDFSCEFQSRSLKRAQNIFISIFFPSVIWINRIAGSLAASLIELSPIPVDDNLMIPIVSGGMMTLFRGASL